jgi:hypothetical protein
MSSQKKQRTRIEDLPDDGTELFDLSEEMLMMVGVFGSSGLANPLGGTLDFHPTDWITPDGQTVTDYDVVWD